MTWWIYGFVFGLTLGTVMLAAGVQMTKRRVQRALEALIDEGRFRVQSRDGAAVNARGLTEALDAALAAPAPGVTPKKLVLAAVVIACTGAAAGLLLVSLASGH